jgi:hypothetical protein
MVIHLKKIILSFLVLFLASSCGPKQGQVERIIEDDVEVVINHLEPYRIKGEPTTLTLEKVFAIDTESDKMAEIGLVEMSDFNVDSFGNIYIMLRETSGNFIFKFDKQGTFMTSFRRRGQGPGEADWGGDILIDEYDRVIAKDMTKPMFSIFDPDGTLVKETKLGRNYSLIEYLNEGKFFIDWQEQDLENQVFRNHFGIADGTFEKIEEFYGFEMPDRFNAERFTPVTRGFVLTASQKNIFITNYQALDSYEFLVFDIEGNLVRKIRKEYSPVPVPDNYKRLIKKRLERTPLGRELTKRMYFPPHWPPNRYVFTDDEGRLYVMTYERDEDERKYMYDIFNAEGVFIGRMSLGNIQNRYVEDEIYHDDPKKVLVKGGYLYCIQEKESGFIELVVYKMKWE